MGFVGKNTGAYALESAEAEQNAKAVCDVLMPKGWTVEAICGVLGNIGAESGYNPFRWQNDNVLPINDPRIDYQNSHAYGLCQFDPAGKYINYAQSYPGYAPNYSNHPGNPTDGKAQMLWINDHADYIPTQSFPLSYAEYKVATIDNYTIQYLTMTWFYNYERGTWSNTRVSAATYWYNKLRNYQPTGASIPIWLLFKIKEGGKL